METEEVAYAIEARWVTHSNPAADTPYTIYLDGEEVAKVLVDQRSNSGQFIPLGVFNFAPGVLEVVVTDDASGFVTADAIRVSRADGTGPLEVIDNTDLEFSVTGNWESSSDTPGYYGSDYRFSSGGTGANSATWSFEIVSPETEGVAYAIEARWTAHSKAAANTAYTIYLDGQEVAKVLVDQGANGGQFTPLGVFNLVPGVLEIVVTDNASGYVTADAVRLSRAGSNDSGSLEVIDNTDPEFSVTGGWGSSSDTPGYYGLDYRFSSGGTGTNTATWTFEIVSPEPSI